MKPFLTIERGRTVVITAKEFAAAIESAKAQGLITMRPDANDQTPDMVQRERQRVCMARLRAERAANKPTEYPPRIRLTEDDVRRIRKSLEAGMKPKDIAAQVKLTTTAIYHLRSGRTHRAVF